MDVSARFLTGWIALLTVATVVAQPLAPITDTVDKPLLPPGIATDDVEVFGALVYLWREDTGAEVIHVVGDFEMHLGPRRLRAREAVIWMTKQSYEGRPYQAFDIFLWQNARVIEPAGTVTTGPVLFVTLNSSGKVRVSADKKAFASSADRTVYEQARRLRETLHRSAAQPPSGRKAFNVVEPKAEAGTPIREVRRPVSYRAQDLSVRKVNGRRVIMARGNVYLFRGDPAGQDYLELRADAAVIYLASAQDGSSASEGGLLEDLSDEADRADDGEASPASPGPRAEVPKGLGLGGAGTGDVEGVYLEGDIVLTRGERMIRASRLYYDFQHDRALILDAVFRTFLPERNVPVYVRAERIRQLSATQWVADRARITTSEFHTPHYHVGASEIELEDKTERALAGLRKGTYKMRNVTFNIGGAPWLYWPYTEGTLKEGETSIRRMRTGYSDQFGLEIETEWQLFNLLGFETPVGFDAALHLDEYTERGTGVGVDLDYQRDSYFGLLRTYQIHDSGEDNLGGRFRDEEPDTNDRGRWTWRHRHYLPNDWELTFEASYISDKNFLEEYFENEFDTGKEQETLLYLKKQHDNWAFTVLAQARPLDFTTQTEHMPDLSFRLIGASLGNVATLFSENRAGWVRYRPAERNLHDFFRYGRAGDASGTTGRADTRQELEVPLDLGPLRVVPFGMVRASAWDDSPDSGGTTRVLGGGGVRGSMYLTRTFDVESELWDIHGLRHIIKPDVTAWVLGSTRASNELFPFEENVEDLDEVDGVTIGLRQRLQTKRGAPGRQRIADLLTLDVEAGFFNQAQNGERTYGFASYSRPENSISRNYLNTSLIWRVSDTTALISESNFDLNDGELDLLNVSYVVERPPRLSYLIGYRFIEEIDSNLLALGANYQLSEKHTLAVREEFDLERGDTLQFSMTFIRRLPRWYMAVTFDLDRIEDDFGVSLSVWPEGFPRAVIGSRRYTGVATSTAIRPE